CGGSHISITPDFRLSFRAATFLFSPIYSAVPRFWIRTLGARRSARIFFLDPVAERPPRIIDIKSGGLCVAEPRAIQQRIGAGFRFKPDIPPTRWHRAFEERPRSNFFESIGGCAGP